MFAVDAAIIAQVRSIPAVGANLLAYQTGDCIPFVMRRVFVVHSFESTERGRHAHKLCGQVMVCLTGRCTIMLDDGESRKTVELARPRDTLYVPPSIWVTQSYEPGSILMVMCDQDYDESDYIRNYDAFLAYRKGGA